LGLRQKKGLHHIVPTLSTRYQVVRTLHQHTWPLSGRSNLVVAVGRERLEPDGMNESSITTNLEQKVPFAMQETLGRNADYLSAVLMLSIFVSKLYCVTCKPGYATEL